jgi:hypothetical protein
MNITVLTCSNGWVAIYGPTGAHVATYGPQEKIKVNLAEFPEPTVTVIAVPVDSRYKDFPRHL